MVQGFRYSNFFRVKSQVMKLVFGLALSKSIDSFRRDVGFSADAHRHQVPFGFLFKQVGLRFIHPLSFGSSPPLSRLWTRLLRHPAFPLVHQLLLVRTSWYILWSFMYSYVCYADPMERSALKYTRHQLLASLHCWCGAWGDTCGGKLALRAGGRRHQCWHRWSMSA